MFSDFTRRDFVKLSFASAFGVSYSGWLPKLAQAAEVAGKVGEQNTSRSFCSG